MLNYIISDRGPVGETVEIFRDSLYASHTVIFLLDPEDDDRRQVVLEGSEDLLAHMRRVCVAYVILAQTIRDPITRESLSLDVRQMLLASDVIVKDLDEVLAMGASIVCHLGDSRDALRTVRRARRRMAVFRFFVRPLAALANRLDRRELGRREADA